MKQGLFFRVDEKSVHGGLVDQFKPIIGLYYTAKCSQVPFYLIHHGYGDIRQYLLPAKVDWSAEESDLSHLWWRTRKYEYLYPVDSVPVLEKKNIQYVCRYYYPRNILDCLGKTDWMEETGRLFRELFRLSPLLKNSMENSGLPEKYDAVHIRFVNSIGKTEDSLFNAPLQKDEQERLIDQMIMKIVGLKEKTGKQLAVFADNPRFLSRIEQAGIGVYAADPAHAGHIAYTDDQKTVLQTYTDFFLISEADTVYSVAYADGFNKNALYPSRYARYAAIIGGKSFCQI